MDSLESHHAQTKLEAFHLIQPQSTSRQAPEETASPLESTWRQYSSTWVMIVFTTIWVVLTILFGFNSTLDKPLSSRFILPDPTQTVTILNILSHIAVFLLQNVVSDVFEAMRWAGAGMRRGILSLSFIALSRATAPLGVIYLVLFASGKGHRFWGCLRYTNRVICSDCSLFFVVIHTIVGIALLTNVSFRTSWQVIQQVPLQAAGLGPLDPYETNDYGVAYFWYFYSGVLSDPSLVTAIPSHSCTSSSECLSLFFPGGTNTISPHPATLQNQSEEASAFIVFNNPGYNVEFYPIQGEAVFDTSTDCRSYVFSEQQGLGLCVKRQGNAFIGGISQRL